MNNKTCTNCKITQPLNQFVKDKRKKDGLYSQCKTCSKKYREANKETIKIQRKTYREKNKEKIKKQRESYFSSPEYKEYKAAYDKEYREKNKERKRKNDKEYYEKNKKQIAIQSKEYREANKEKLSIKSKEYYEKNKETRCQYSRDWWKRRVAKEPAFVYKITCSENNWVYIGETLRGKYRRDDHLNALRRGKHENPLFQKDFDKFGEHSFKWEIIKECPKNKDILLEQEALVVKEYIKKGVNLYNAGLSIEQIKTLLENK